MKDKKIKAPEQPDFVLAEEFILSELLNGLSSHLYYHGYHHTIDVLEAAMSIASHENLSNENIRLLRIAVLFHDSGFLRSYDNHEEKGCDLVKEYLPGFGFSKSQIKIICEMIMATKVPQKPKNILEQILCDADLDYLGRNDVEEVSKSLMEELKFQKKLIDIKVWNEMQIDFLRIHRYNTEYSIKNREPKKLEYLNRLLEETNYNNN